MIGAKRLDWFAVTGHSHGDDEPSTMIFQAEDREHAVEQFVDAMDSGSMNDDEKESIEEMTGVPLGIYVNTVVRSRTPICDGDEEPPEIGPEARQ